MYFTYIFTLHNVGFAVLLSFLFHSFQVLSEFSLSDGKSSKQFRRIANPKFPQKSNSCCSYYTLISSVSSFKRQKGSVQYECNVSFGSKAARVKNPGIYFSEFPPFSSRLFCTGLHRLGCVIAVIVTDCWLR